MCLATPAKVIKLNKNIATVYQDGQIREIDITLLSDVKLGEYVLAHANLGLNKLEEDEAQEILALIKDCQH
jgi:hydrogenase expression/formation protein HypC